MLQLFLLKCTQNWLFNYRENKGQVALLDLQALEQWLWVEQFTRRNPDLLYMLKFFSHVVHNSIDVLCFRAHLVSQVLLVQLGLLDLS